MQEMDSVAELLKLQKQLEQIDNDKGDQTQLDPTLNCPTALAWRLHIWNSLFVSACVLF